MANQAAEDIAGCRSLANILYKNTGVTIKEEKYFLFKNRLGKRLIENQIRNLRQYAQLIDKSAAEMSAFISIMTTHKTHFFRENKHFEMYMEDLKERKPESVNVICAACSTGEEVYSVAAHLMKLKRLLAFDFRVLGFDICQESVAFAERGIYKSGWEQVTEEGMGDHFTKQGAAGVKPNAELKSHVKFRRMSIIDLNLPDRFVADAIFMRNVLIYFDDSMIRRALAEVSRHHRRGGTLFLGMSEYVESNIYKAVGSSTYEKVS